MRGAAAAVAASFGIGGALLHCGARSALDGYGGDAGDAAVKRDAEGLDAPQASDRDAAPYEVPQIVAGEVHACLLTLAGVVLCWGANANGQLGDGTTEDRSTPVRVAGLPKVVAITAGAHFTCALAA